MIIDIQNFIRENHNKENLNLNLIGLANIN